MEIHFGTKQISMKKNLLYVGMLAMSMVVVGCSNDDDTVEQSAVNSKLTLIANTQIDTRTSLGDQNQVLWSKGDKIVLSKQGVIGGNTYELTLDGEGGSSQGVFVGKTETLLSGKFQARYYGHTTDIIPATQTYDASGNISYAPMEARDITINDGKASTAVFHNLCGLFCVTISNATGVQKKIHEIVISADEAMAGEYTIDNSGVLTINSSSTSKSIILDCGNGNDGVTLSNSGTKFYFVMPAKEYSHVSIKMIDESGATCTKSLKNEIKLKIEKNKVTTASFSASEFIAPLQYTEKENKKYYGDHEYVDLGLSVLWATENVGADLKSTKKDDYCGDFFAWGEVTEKSAFTQGNYQLSLIKEDKSNYVRDGILRLAYDAANHQWGGNWRMPTRTEMIELIQSCTWETTNKNIGNRVYVQGLTGTCNGKSIFLPGNGNRPNASTSTNLFYWTSTISDKIVDNNVNVAYDLNTVSSTVPTKGEPYGYINTISRYNGLLIRPVCPKPTSNK